MQTCGTGAIMHKQQLCNLLPNGKCNDIIITSHVDRVKLA